MQGNQTTKQRAAASRQAVFGPHVIVCGHDVRNVGEIECIWFSRGFREIVLPGGEIKGSARVHRWTLSKISGGRMRNCGSGPATLRIVIVAIRKASFD
jgi:hypothetical protein